MKPDSPSEEVALQEEIAASVTDHPRSVKRNVVMSVWLPAELRARMAALAEARDTNMSTELRRAIRMHLRIAEGEIDS